MFYGSGQRLEPGGSFFLYGPFNEGGKATAESNAEFDRHLQARDPAMGLRDVETLDALARRHRMRLSGLRCRPTISCWCSRGTMGRAPMSERYESGAADRGGLVAQARALLSGQRDLVANAANLSSLLFHGMKDLNWVGFYFVKGRELVVGPFQGKPACVTIPLGRGVCGTAAEKRAIQRVPDVHAFDGHIACDVESRSEIAGLSSRRRASGSVRATSRDPRCRR